MFDNYKKYLKFLDKHLSEYFENQKSYIFCKKGCAKCCKNAEFPYSTLEMQYLMHGYINLDISTKEKINKNIETLKQEKSKHTGKFFYSCPFLIDNVCSVYNYRGIVCRAFGLLETTQDEKTIKVPFCCHEGLNYSNVYDKTTGHINYSKNEIQPTAFNISYKALTSKTYEEKFDLAFGEKRKMIDWFD